MQKRKTVLYLHSQSETIASLTGEMAEWSNAAVLKTVDCNRSGGSNPSFSAKETRNESFGFFVFRPRQKFTFAGERKTKKQGFAKAVGFLLQVHPQGNYEVNPLKKYLTATGSPPLNIKCKRNPKLSFRVFCFQTALKVHFCRREENKKTRLCKSRRVSFAGSPPRDLRS